MPFVSYQQLREINAFDYLVQFEGFNVSTKSNKSRAVSRGAYSSTVIEDPGTGTRYLIKKDVLYPNEYRISSTDGIEIKTEWGNSANFDLVSFIAYLHNQSFNNAAITIAHEMNENFIPNYVFNYYPLKFLF